MKPRAYSVLLVFVFTLILLPAFSQETLTITTYYPSPYGSYKNLGIYNEDESTTQTDFTQALTKAGLLITTDYTDTAYTPGIFWSTHDNNATRPKAGIYLRETNTGTRMYFGTSNDYATGITNDAVVINELGNVGIGTAAPVSRLHVVGSQFRWDSSTTGTDPGILFLSSGAGYAEINAGQVQNYTAAKNLVLNNTSGGNVGIGTSTPNSKLNIMGNDAVNTVNLAIQNTNAGGAEITLRRSTGILGGRLLWDNNNVNFWVNSGPSANLIFGTGGTNERMRIDTSGNVGIGTVNPGEKLEIGASGNLLLKASANDPGDIIFQTSAGVQKGRIWTDPGINTLYLSSADNVQDIIIDPSGNVGIGTVNPGAFKIWINGPGHLQAAAWDYASDRRLKENISYIQSGLSIIEQLKPVKFDYIKGDKKQAGFIAQEIEEVLPDIVTKGEDGMLGMKTESIIPYLVKAVQEQQKEIEELKAEVQQLKRGQQE